MATNKKHKGKVDESNLNEWLCSTGFLFPTNALQLARFDELYADFDFKLKDASIDIESIIEGNICYCGTKVFSEIEELNSEIEELKMVARKGQEIPKQIINKMLQKHHKKNDGEEK